MRLSFKLSWLFNVLRVLIHASGSSHLSKNQAMYDWWDIKMTEKHWAFVAYAFLVSAYADGLISSPALRKSHLGFVRRAGAIPPPAPLLWLRRNCCYQNFCKGIRMMKNEPTEPVCSSSGWYNLCKNQNQPSPAKILQQRWALCTDWGTDLHAEWLYCSGCVKRRYHQER